jgi:ATP/maltotriose-dependent transcriptional regulator MalT
VKTTGGGRTERRRPERPAEPPIGAKALPPRPRSAHVRRDALLEILRPHRGVAVLIAPPGFGKTTLLGQWAAADDRPFAWVAIDPEDNDPVVLWSYITMAIRSLDVEGAAPRSSVVDLSSSHERVVPQLLTHLDALRSEVVLVLEDFHWITNPVCLATVAKFLEHRPDNVTVALSARADPDLPIGELRVQSDLLELRAAELAFSLEESEAFLNGCLALGIGPEAIRSLWDHTEGWPAGLYLAYLSLRDVPDRDAFVEQFRGSSRRVVDYLTEVVVGALDERTREFLLQSSILDRMTGPLCDAVLETHDSARLLQTLERANLFIVGLDDHREWYRYHRLFGELLLDELERRRPERVRGLHARAAAWFRDVGDTGRVIVHALAAGEREMAIRAVAENYLRTLEWGGLATIEGWLGAFPRSVVAADARLSVVEAWVMSFQGRYLEADLALENARRAEYHGALPDGAGSIAASAALVRASAPRGNIADMLRAARTAFDLEGDADSMWRVTTHVQLGWALALSGAFADAEPLLKRAAAQAPMSEQWMDALGARCLLAWTNLYQGRLEDADRWSNDAIGVVEARRFAETAAGHWAYATLGAVRAAQGRIEEANDLLGRSIDGMRAATPPILLVNALLAFAPVARARRGSAEGLAVLQEARAIVQGCEDAGILGRELEQVAKALVPAPRVRGGGSLTDRERDVLRLLEKGMSKRDVARALYVSYNTVHSHTKSIYRKLGAFSRAEAIERAREWGILEESSVSPG